ncbi:MAG: sensor histidine kinase [Romboutsia sp.]|uniref:sensor histidine kinase n=1 Tax=Romboutsia sp. TaxID=1965302 RepID=UPI003F3CA5F8
MSVPEVLVVHMLANSFIGNKVDFKKNLKVSLLFGIICYIIKNLFKGGIDTVLIIFAVTMLYYASSKISLLSSFILIAISYGIKFISEFLIVSFGTSIGIPLAIILNDRITKIVFLNLTLIAPILIIKLNLSRNIKLFNLPIKKDIKIAKNKFIMYVLIFVGSANIFIISGLVAISKINNYRTYKDYEIGLITMVVISVISLIIVVLNLERSKDTVLIENNIMEANLKQMEETVDLLRIQRHDMMNHLQVILMQINNNNNENAKRYILALAENAKNTDIVFDTGNNYIDAILNFKNTKCTDSEIVLTACIDSLLEGTAFDDTQLSAIFLNIIDNAIDELKTSKEEYKYIHVDTFYQDNNHIISIKNNGSKINDPEKIFEIGVSSKGENRGYGLYAIKQLLLKHKSKIYVMSDDDETEFIIEIPKQINILNKFA